MVNHISQFINSPNHWQYKQLSEEFFQYNYAGPGSHFSFPYNFVRPVKKKPIYLVEKVLKTSKNKMYVKWLGLPSSTNSWIDKKNFVSFE